MALIIEGSFTITQLSRDQPLGITVTQKDLAEGTDVNFVDEKEYWKTYKLSDGTTPSQPSFRWRETTKEM